MPISHVIGFDDSPFDRRHRGDVRVVGAVYAGTRLEGILSGRVRRDGANAARNLERLVAGSKFRPQLQLIMLQGVALAGFNVVDVRALSAGVGGPVLVVSRRRPRLERVRAALLRLPGGARRWRLIEALGPMEPLRGVFVQRVGLSPEAALEALERTTAHGTIPEPLRTAHLVAGGVATGQSRGRT